MNASPIIVWVRRDLRLADQPALFFAAAQNRPIVPVFIWSPGEEGDWPPGGAHKWWLHQSLKAYDISLSPHGLRLIIREGDCLKNLMSLAHETGAGEVFWNTSYEPAGRALDVYVERELQTSGIQPALFEGQILHDPESVRTGSGNPYRVFTPFWKKLSAELSVPEPLPAPAFSSAHVPETWPASLDLDRLALEPVVNWAQGIRKAWTPGEASAGNRLAHFVGHLLEDYDTLRDRMDLDGTSRLSPHLHFGEISARIIWHAVLEVRRKGTKTDSYDTYLSEIAWREFSYHLLHHFPESTHANFNDVFDRFDWHVDEAALRRWQKGLTGYPIVDAAMRQLWQTGWMHNRARMIVASFLTKHLLIPWQKGAEWFWDTLVDGNLANNTMGWQWSAGSGADAQPYFRIFNPISQGKRFDPNGDYVRRWIPELRNVPLPYAHEPWTMASQPAGYPLPVVDHKQARERALDRYHAMRKQNV